MYKRKIVEYYAKQPNSVTLDIPLFIRLMEYCKESAATLTDEAIHRIAEKVQKANEEWDVVTMESYQTVMSQ
jgi:hypothetical protein